MSKSGRLKLKLRDSVVLRSFRILPKSDRRKYFAVIGFQIFLSFLDLLGVAIFGIIGALAVTGVESHTPGNRVSTVIRILRLDNFSFQMQIALLAVMATLVLISRTAFSILITRRVFFFLSRRGAHISASLLSTLLVQPLTKIYSRSNQETVYALTTGVNAITLGVLGTTVTLIADGSLLLILLTGLFIVDPVIAITTIIFFGSLGFILYRLMNVRAHQLGFLSSDLSVLSNERILEALSSYRELVVRNRRTFYVSEIGKLRMRLADVVAEVQFMPNVSKYVVESGIVLGGLLVAGVEFVFLDARHAVGTLSIFLAAGTRIAPAIMRLQQSLIQIKNGVGTAMPTLILIESFDGQIEDECLAVELDTVHLGFEARLELKNVFLSYPNNDDATLKNMNLEVKNGEFIALVGPSGAGKTSLADSLLGVLAIDSGEIHISGRAPLAAIAAWPGAMAYVPQDIMISNGTIRENVALGFPIETASEELIWEALEISQLTGVVRSMPEGLDTRVGERGMKLSGGQRQRLGIARAMFTNPKLIVLDEATSSLDGQTEADISDAIANLQGSVTVIMIAHRLSTVRNADQVIYMDKGRIIAQGTFEEVRRAVPDFDAQAKLMGL
jgi:ATP-binding cassette, subfamily B, bacterial PglK